MSTELILAIVAGALVALLYGWYVSLVSRRNRAREALSSIDVQLRKRFDLIPNVLTIAKKFMNHEKELLERLTELRAQMGGGLDKGDVAHLSQQFASAGELQGLMGRLFAVSENYPDLRSSETMINAQNTYQEVEGHISAARRFYNSAVTDLNNSVQIWPGSMIAAMAGIQAMPFYEIEDAAARQPVSAADHL